MRRVCSCTQVADEYGSEAYRGAVDVTLFDTAGKEIKALTGIQDAEIEVDAHGTKVHTLLSQGMGSNVYPRP